VIRLCQTVLLIDGETAAEDIVHDTRYGASVIRLGQALVIGLDTAPQDVLDQLAAVTAAAAAEGRARTLKAVAA
jgi:hypothetical protein